jgi:photosystem II stability/assembly factor-like uncharacterized protein
LAAPDNRQPYGKRAGHKVTGAGGIVLANVLQHPNDTTLVDVDMLSPTVGWAINAEGQVLKTAKGSRHWSNGSPRRLTATLKPLAAKDFHGGKTVAFPNP